MSGHRCCIVPPYMLRAIADSDHNPAELKAAAHSALAHNQHYHEVRQNKITSLAQPGPHRGTHRHGFVPDQILIHIAESEHVDEDTRARAKRDLEHAQSVRGQRTDETGTGEQTTLAAKKPQPSTGFYRAVYDAQHTEDDSKLPGKLLRVEGQKAVKDTAANEAYDNVGHTLDFYKKNFNWNSIDGKGMHIVSSVHFSNQYENAFWTSELQQMVFGDGGSFLYNFTKSTDVIGHELTHGVTEHVSPLIYQDQSGALNESMSDVFGVMIKQMVENEDAKTADWLIGEGCLLPDVKGVALRSMKAPGTAYDDPRFGKDPQPDNFAQYVHTSEDNGGVHLYSGIPNKAFYLVATALGGYSWEKAGKIWWQTLSSGRVPSRSSFLQFADVTVEVAQESFGDDVAKTVRNAWNQVGVVRKGH